MKIAGFEGAFANKKKNATYMKMPQKPLERHPACHVVLPQGFADHFMLHQPFSL